MIGKRLLVLNKISLQVILVFSLSVVWYHVLGQQRDPGISLEAGNKRIEILKDGGPLLQIDSISFNFRSQSSQEIVYEGQDSIVIALEYPNIPEFYQVDKVKDHTENLIITCKEGVFHFFVAPEWAQNFTIHLADHPEDHFFGLIESLYPYNKRSPDLKGETIDIAINGETSRLHENFTSVLSSFYYNPKGYASFVNTFATGKYILSINGKTSIYHDTGKLDWYVFTGPSQQIYQSYYQVIGKPKFVPIWACGPNFWRDQNDGGAKEIVDDAQRFIDLKIPITSIMVDRPYSNGAQNWSKMDFNEKFSQPEKWIKQLNDMGIEFLTWIAPATFTDKDFPGLLEGSFGYIDLTHPDGVSEFGNRLGKQYELGVKGHKMDRGDEKFPQFENWFDGTGKRERQNKYVYLYAKVTDSIITAHHGKDQFTYTRTAIHGSQPYLSAIWGGDVRTNWSGIASNLANALRVSYMGFPNWGTDVGGYNGAGTVPDDLYTRWLQWGVFNGFFEIKIDGEGGKGPDRTPWNYSLAVQEAFRKSCEQRMEWLPHVFSQANSSDKYGPLMKPLGMVWPDDPKTYPIWDEYLFGNTVLVVPVISTDSVRKLYLPEGDWIDFYSNDRLAGNQWIEVAVQMDRIPLFAKANSLQLRGNIYAGNQINWDQGAANQYVDVWYYPGTGGAEIDFIDPKGENRASVIQASTSEEVIRVEVPAIGYAGKVKVWLSQKPKKVKLNGKKASTVYENSFLILDRVPDSPSDITIEL